MVIIKSENLIIKNIEEKDLIILMRWRNMKEVSDFLFNDMTYTLEGQKRWFDKIKSDKENIYLIVKDLNDKSFGEARITNIDLKNKKCEIGGHIGEQNFKGKGLGKEIFKILTDYCFKELRMNKVYLKVFKFNEIAIHVYKSLGFKTEGILRQDIFKKEKFEDVLVMSVLRN